MTIEERIEVLFRFHEDHEANLNRLFELQARNEEQQAKNEKMLAQLLEGMLQHKESIIGLARIAEAHEHRISGLEEGRQ